MNLDRSASAPGSRVAAVEFQGVRKSLGGRVVLDGFSLSVESGETVALIGPSGSGKTTALKLVNRLLEPEGGSVRVEGREVRGEDPIALRRSLGYVIQEGGLFPHWSVRENVETVPRLLGWPEERRRRRSEELLEMVGLPPSEFAGRRPRELSGGQRQRVGVARALAADPATVLMDEPFGALDPIARGSLQREFLEWKRRLCKAVLLVTHDLREAFRLADRVAVLDRGRLRQVGTRRELESAPADDFVREFVAQGDGVSDFARYFWERRGEIGALAGQHVALVAVSTALAVAVGLPLGVALTRRPRLARPVLAAASVVQTIPSLALFGFLIPLPLIGGIGARTAIVALLVYALLPILRNTHAGIISVDPAIVEAATGLGMTPRERLRSVELPLALPVVLAGVRIAAVVSIGLATIAAAVGAGGLGVLIYRGIATVDNRLILAGAVPAALLALLVDGALGLAERRWSAWRTP